MRQPEQGSINQKDIGDRPAVTAEPREAQPDLTSKQLEELKKQHEKDQRRRGNKLATVGKVALAGGVLAGGGVVLYETVPAIHRAVDQFVAKHWAGIGTSAQTGKIDATFEAPRAEVPLTFDLNADSGIIGPQNSIVLTQETDPEAVAAKSGIGLADKNLPEARIPLTIFNEDRTIPVIKYEFSRSAISMVDNNMVSITEGIQPNMIVTSPIKGTVYHSEAGRFMRNDGLLRRPTYTLEGIDNDGNPIVIYIRTDSDISPLLETSRLEDYNGKEKEMPKVEINIGDPIYQFKNIRKDDYDGKSLLSYSTSGVGKIGVNSKDGKVVFATKSQPSTAQQTP